MKFSLIGYGKMGKAIEQIALDRNHHIVHRIGQGEASSIEHITPSNTDVAIEFSAPNHAFENISYCIKHGIPVVSGTTGWLDKLPDVHRLVESYSGAFFYASNFSIGVNILFKINQQLAHIMNYYPDYEVKLKEIHHKEKKDAPSGTAISLAEAISVQLERKHGWALAPAESSLALEIESIREPHVPGTHQIEYTSEIDSIEIKHIAHNRKGFAFGAVLAAEWLSNREGVFGMKDLLDWF